MKARFAFVLGTVSGLAAAAQGQELIRVTYSWQEYITGTTTPVSNSNGILDPGESARISLNILALINGTNAVGQTTTYPTPPPPGVGTVRGFASMYYNLRGDFVGAGGASGTWGTRTISTVFNAGVSTGTPMLNGGLLDSFGGSQFIGPGGTANGANPINNAFRGFFTPSNYSHDLFFRVEPATAVGSGQHNSLLIAHSISHPDPDPTTWFDNYTSKNVGTDFGNGLYIPIIPSPSTALIATLAIVSSARPRRRSGAAP